MTSVYSLVHNVSYSQKYTLKVIVCLFVQVCVGAAKYLVNYSTDMILLYGDASHRNRESLKQFWRSLPQTFQEKYFLEKKPNPK